MKERGIIFKGWGVNAIRNMKPGVWPAEAIDPALPIKWQTRRTRGLDVVNERPDDWRFEGFRQDRPGVAIFGDMASAEPTKIEIKCPYGVPGDGLWVRETCKLFGVVGTRNSPATRPVQYKADDAWGYPPATERLSPVDAHWRPSIHMFRWASREDLLVKEIRVERVQKISEEDARAEGTTDFGCDTIDWFRDVWDQIHGKGAWERNDHVWVPSFMRKAK